MHQFTIMMISKRIWMIKISMNKRTSLENLELARNDKGPMYSRNLSYSISLQGQLPEMKSNIKKQFMRMQLTFWIYLLKTSATKGFLKKKSLRLVRTSRAIFKPLQALWNEVELEGLCLETCTEIFFTKMQLYQNRKKFD